MKSTLTVLLAACLFADTDVRPVRRTLRYHTLFPSLRGRRDRESFGWPFIARQLESITSNGTLSSSTTSISSSISASDAITSTVTVIPHGGDGSDGLGEISIPADCASACEGFEAALSACRNQPDDGACLCTDATFLGMIGCVNLFRREEHAETITCSCYSCYPPNLEQYDGNAQKLVDEAKAQCDAAGRTLKVGAVSLMSPYASTSTVTASQTGLSMIEPGTEDNTSAGRTTAGMAQNVTSGAAHTATGSKLVSVTVLLALSAFAISVIV